MSYTIRISKTIQKQIEKSRHGIGKPEPLKGGHDVTYSRRLSGKDRIIYDIYDDIILIELLDVGGHYGGK
jgi:toxin YoeB